MKKIIIRVAIALVALAIIGIIVAGLYVDTIAKKSIEKVGPMLTKVEVRLDEVTLSMLSGGGSIKGLVVGNPEGYKAPQAIQVGRAKLSVSPGSLLADKIVVRTIEVEDPVINFETDLTSNNLNKILANIEEATGGPSTEPDPAKDEPGKKIQVDNFLIKGAKLNVSITSLGGKSLTVPLPTIQLQNMGQGPEGITMGSLLKQVFAAIESSAVKAAGDAANQLGTQAVGAAKDAASGATDQVKKGIGGLFKK